MLVTINFLIGVFVVSSVIHELSHKQDFENLPKYTDGICVLNMPENLTAKNWTAAYYYYMYNPTDENVKMVDNIKSYTEYKAYTLDSLYALLSVTVGIFLIVFLFRNGNQKRELTKL